jgi:hypothetical protein
MRAIFSSDMFDESVLCLEEGEFMFRIVKRCELCSCTSVYARMTVVERDDVTGGKVFEVIFNLGHFPSK